MNEIDPSSRFSARNVRSFDEGASLPVRPVALNAMARQIATQYRRDTMSPVMVSGILRIVEFVAIGVVGAALYLTYVKVNPALFWEYPLAIVAGAAFAVIALEIADGYQVSVLRRPFGHIGSSWSRGAPASRCWRSQASSLKLSEVFSRVWYAGWYGGGFVALIGLRVVIARIIRLWARNGRMERRA